MGLLNAVRSAVAIANTVTADLQPEVTHEVYLYSDGAGKRIYEAAVSRPAIVIKKLRMVRSPQGELVMSTSQVVFLDPTIEVSLSDRITLPDGTTGPILGTGGFVDRETGGLILTEVYLG